MFHSRYIAPHSEEELLTVLRQYGSDARLIAGGTDLVPQMRLGKLSPKVLVDPLRLPLDGIDASNGYVHLGARITHSQVIASPFLQQEFPALVEACRQVGGPPVRNRGTLAGNLANASPAADSALPLLIYDAQVGVNNLAGGRLIPLNEFYLGPGQTSLAPDEFIREIVIPRVPLKTVAVFLKLGNRHAMAIAVASVAVRLTLDEEGNVHQSRIALGSVAPRPMRAFEAETILESVPFTQKTFCLAADAAQQAASPITDLRASAHYRSKMVAVLTHRALEIAQAMLSSLKNNG